MKTMNRFYIVLAIIAAAIVGWGSANAGLNPPTTANTELSSSIPGYKQTAATTSTPNLSVVLPTSSTSLVGHWGRYIDGELSDTEQCYFGELNEDGIGPYFEISKGKYIEGTYSIGSKDLDSTEVVIQIKGDPNVLIRSLKLSRFFSHPSPEGLAEYQYMDSLTEPDSWTPIVKKYKYE